MLCMSTTNLQHQEIVTMFYMLESYINSPNNDTKFEWKKRICKNNVQGRPGIQELHHKAKEHYT